MCIVSSSSLFQRTSPGSVGDGIANCEEFKRMMLWDSHLPFTLGKVLLDLSADRLMNVPIKSRVSGNPSKVEMGDGLQKQFL